MAKCPECGTYRFSQGGYTPCPKCGGRMVKVERRYKPLNFERELLAARGLRQ